MDWTRINDNDVNGEKIHPAYIVKRSTLGSERVS